MKLTLGFSPCPNDTFIFDAMVHGRIDTEGLKFEYKLSDVEELNRLAFSGKTDITKISSHAYAYAAGNYLILDSGSALGRNNGPLLISKEKIDIADLVNARIAIPGKYTTANLLFSIAWPDAKDKKEYIFSEIEEALLNEEVDAGLIIHETRFTYQRKGLMKIADMGEIWKKYSNTPIPLGFIVIKRSIPEEVSLKVNRILKRSIDYASRNPLASSEFVASNAREMESDVMKKHIDLYVNEYTAELGIKGRQAIDKLFHVAGRSGVVPDLPPRIFLTSVG